MSQMVLGAALVTSAVCSALAGCGAAQPADDRRSTDHMKVVGLLLAEYASSHGGAMPATQEDFVKFLEREPANWNKLVSAPAELLNSPRNGKPLTLVLGAKPKEPADGSLPWIAYESEGVDGKHFMVNLRGNVREVSTAELAQYFTAS